MKKFLLGAAVLGLAAWMIFGPVADAQRLDGTSVRQLWTPPQGYSALVCSTWNNDSDPDGGYIDLANKSGYFYHLIAVHEDSCSAPQQVTIRFWSSSTDSTTIYNGAITLDLAEAGTGWHYFPVKCYKVTFTSVDNTDDITVVGYAREY